MLEIVIRYFLPALHEALGVYLPLITTELRGAGRDHPSPWTKGYNYPEALVAALEPVWASCWRWCCSAACAGAWTRPSRPRRSRGMPITLISAALVSFELHVLPAGVADNRVRRAVGRGRMDTDVWTVALMAAVGLVGIRYRC